MTFLTNKYLIEGIDRLGKDTLIQGILNQRGFHQVIHYSKPAVLDVYKGVLHGDEVANALQIYQEQSFRTMFALLADSPYAKLILNRAHLGECVYAPMYRGYPGDYVFELERRYLGATSSVRLILLTEDFDIAKHFVDDGESLGAITNREREQNLFLAAFERSHIMDKRIVCVTDHATGRFRPKSEILNAVLEN